MYVFLVALMVLFWSKSSTYLLARERPADYELRLTGVLGFIIFSLLFAYLPLSGEMDSLTYAIRTLLQLLVFILSCLLLRRYSHLSLEDLRDESIRRRIEREKALKH